MLVEIIEITWNHQPRDISGGNVWSGHASGECKDLDVHAPLGQFKMRDLGLWQLPPVMVIFCECSPSFCLHVLPSETSLPGIVWLELWILLVRSSMPSHTWPPEPLATGSALWKALMENSWWGARSIYLLVYLLHDCMDTRMPPHFGADGKAQRWHKGLKQIWVWDGVGQSRDTQWLLILREDFKSFTRFGVFLP